MDVNLHIEQNIYIFLKFMGNWIFLFCINKEKHECINILTIRFKVEKS